MIETFGLHKQGGQHFTYLHSRGYHPLLAVLAESGEVIHSRLREGKASAGRGAASFARQTLVRLARLGPSQEVVVDVLGRGGARRRNQAITQRLTHPST